MVLVAPVFVERVSARMVRIWWSNGAVTFAAVEPRERAPQQARGTG